MKAADPYVCNNEPRPRPGDVYPIQVGWTRDGRRLMATADVLPSVAECRYDNPGADPRCTGCRHATKGTTT